MKHYRYNHAILLSLLTCIALLTASCKTAIYVPGEGDVIQLQVETTSIVPGGFVIIMITGMKASGHPMPDNTLVQLTADSGKFLDSEGNKIAAVRLITGKAQATYQSDENFTGESVTITAQSGSAVVSPEQLVITITRIEITQLFMTANPLKLPPSGGTTEITVTAYDNQQEAVPGEKIFLETTAGTLTPVSPIITDSAGKVTAMLETNEPATVTANYKEITKAIEINVGVNEPPAAAFEFSPQNPLMGEPVYFISTSSDSDGSIVSHLWNFGDGTPPSNEQNPIHIFPVTQEETEYKVVLTVTDDAGQTNSASQSVTVVPKEIKAAFYFSPENPSSGETVNFISESIGAIDSYQWEFGDGNTSSRANPSNIYYVTKETDFIVKLTVRDDDGNSDSTTQSITISIEDGTVNIPPIVSFTIDPPNPIFGSSVTFNATGSTDDDGRIVWYQWYFGDGEWEEGENKIIVEHTYYYNPENPTNTFNVSLTVTDNRGTKRTETKTIEIVK